MAGSYLHVVDSQGRLKSPTDLNQSLENGGDVYEAVEEMYGMIWMLARVAADGDSAEATEMVENVRRLYRTGLHYSPGVNDDDS